ncbi:DUF4147 domain-containing protein, partial [candidate division WWE3 bacterium]|nr:DUF4147 domain-containing protein [candidate division WWE3 bacterium]
IEELLGDKITQGYAIGVTQGEPLKHITTIVGTHPAPSDINQRATQKIIEMLKSTKDNDLVIGMISGGGSALLAAPHEMTIDAQAAITTELMNAGADITELNIVRKHISDIKGGRLAALAYPAKLITLIFSDVPGNDLSTIASGPTVMDSTTTQQAQEIIKKYEIEERSGINNIFFTESPKDPSVFEHVENILVLDPASAIETMEAKAKELGYATEIYSTTLAGEAGEVGALLLENAKPHTALLASGETTVNVKGNGTGGRNQQLVLENLKNIKPGQVLISAASDGHDHSNSAGAIGDEHSLKRAKEYGLDVDTYIKDSDSYTFFVEMSDSLDTGVLDSNIADMFLVLQE